MGYLGFVSCCQCRCLFTQGDPDVLAYFSAWSRTCQHAGWCWAKCSQHGGHWHIYVCVCVFVFWAPMLRALCPNFLSGCLTLFSLARNFPTVLLRDGAQYSQTLPMFLGTRRNSLKAFGMLPGAYQGSRSLSHTGMSQNHNLPFWVDIFMGTLRSGGPWTPELVTLVDGRWRGHLVG
jgi:hypothetical protein